VEWRLRGLSANSTRAEAVLVCVAEEPKFGPDVSWSRECRKYRRRTRRPSVGPRIWRTLIAKGG